MIRIADGDLVAATQGMARALQTTTALGDLFGFSLGSLVSTEMAVTYPARVGRLVLASGHPRRRVPPRDPGSCADVAAAPDRAAR